jgi:hypothetical protein
MLVRSCIFLYWSNVTHNSIIWDKIGQAIFNIHIFVSPRF